MNQRGTIAWSKSHCLSFQIGGPILAFLMLWFGRSASADERHEAAWRAFAGEPRLESRVWRVQRIDAKQAMSCDIRNVHDRFIGGPHVVNFRNQMAGLMGKYHSRCISQERPPLPGWFST
jgi:hypothetical protein